MAYNKHTSFSETDRQLAAVAKALSHPARIAILRTLAKRGTCICGEIVDVLPLAQSTVSRHLQELKKVDLISGTVDGPKSCYCVNPKILTTLGNALSGLLSGLRKDVAKCC